MVQEQEVRKARKFGGAGMRLGEDLSEPAEAVGGDDSSDDEQPVCAGRCCLAKWLQADSHGDALGMVGFFFVSL